MRQGPSCPTACCLVTFGGLRGSWEAGWEEEVRGSTGHLLNFLGEPGHVPQCLWVSVCPFVMWRAGNPSQLGRGAPAHPPTICPGSLPRQSPAAGPAPAPRGLASQSNPLSASFCRQNQTPVSGKLWPHPALTGMGAPLSPGPGPRFSSLITFPSGLRSLDGRMQFPHWSGRVRRLHDQVSRWVEGGLPCSKDQTSGSVRSTPASGRRQMHATPPQPQDASAMPTSPRLCTGQCSLAPQTYQASPSELSPPPQPLPISACENCPEPPRPSRSSPSSERPPEPLLLPELGKNHPSSLPWPPSAHG